MAERHQILKRMGLIAAEFHKFRKKLMATNPQGQAELNEATLYNVVESYFEDVERHKDYHQSTRIDKPKQAAFTIKWISKLRPIQFNHELRKPSKNMLYANELFALRCGFLFLGLKVQVLPERVYEEALYTLRYRAADERLLLLWLTTIWLWHNPPRPL